AALRDVDQLDRPLVEGALVLGKAVPVRVRAPGDDLALFQQSLEHQLDLEGLVLRFLDSAGDVLEVDEQRQLAFSIHPRCPFVRRTVATSSRVLIFIHYMSPCAIARRGCDGGVYWRPMTRADPALAGPVPPGQSLTTQW